MFKEIEPWLAVIVFIGGQGIFLSMFYYAFTSKVKEIVSKQLDIHDAKSIEKIAKLEETDNKQKDLLNDLDKRVAVIESNQSYVANAILEIKTQVSESFSKINDVWKYLMSKKDDK
jgi:hypothetical protein